MTLGYAMRFIIAVACQFNDEKAILWKLRAERNIDDLL